MTPADFLSRFATVADAPNGIAKLRELILQLAVQGKLVPQDPGDEPAATLLDRICSTGRSLDERTSRPGVEPFRTPTGWEWANLGAIVSKLGAGSTPKGGREVYRSVGVKFLRSQNVWNFGLVLDDVAHISRQIHERMSGTAVRPGDILLNITGASIGRSAVVPDDFDEANVSQHVAIVRPTEPETRRFLHLCLISPLIQGAIDDVQVGISREGLSMSRLRLFTLPVPPLPEQHRIVAKVDELMALCDELEARQERQRTTRRALTASSFDALANAPGADSLAKAWPRVRDHLDELITEPESIPTLRQAILQLAVRGQLVSQDPNDEPAKRLLLAVAQERAKLVSVGLLRGVSTPDRMTLTEELVELPTGWTWASAAEVVLAVTDGDHLPPPKTHSGVPFLVIGNVSKGALDFTDCRRVSRSYYDGLDWIRRPSRGDLLFTVTGSFGIVVPVETDEEFCVQRHIGILKCSKSIPPRYLRLALGSPQAREHSERVATGIAQKTVPLSGLRRLPIPLPPLPEQHRIVAKVDELMSLCDQLEARLTQARATTQALASSTTHHLVTPRGLPAGSSCLAS